MPITKAINTVPIPENITPTLFSINSGKFVVTIAINDSTVLNIFDCIASTLIPLILFNTFLIKSST